MANELKPCPFCGCEAKLTSAAGNYTMIDCRNTKCAVMPSLPGYYPFEHAVKLWNTRHERTCQNIGAVPKDGSGFYPTPHFECSECGASYSLTDYAWYCPSCGAKVLNDD